MAAAAACLGQPEALPGLESPVPVNLVRVERPGVLGVVHRSARSVINGASDRITRRRDPACHLVILPFLRKLWLVGHSILLADSLRVLIPTA
jgi:hypothetical protein